jgi:hypothetical protein
VLRGLALAFPLLVALGSATGAIRLGLGRRWEIVGNTATVVPSPLVTGFFLLVAVAVAVGLFRKRAEALVDEGGVRWERGRKRGYVPFSRLRDATAMGDLLVLDTLDGKIELRVGRGTDFDLVTAISDGVKKQVRLDDETAEDKALLARGGREMGEWLGAVREATKPGPYRGDLAKLEAIATDERRDPEMRAGAVHALLARRDDAVTARIAARIGPSSPPIVLAAAAMAAPKRIDPALVRAAERFLGGEPRVRVADAADEIEDEPVEEEEKAARRSN